MCFGGFIFRSIFRWLWCTVYTRYYLYLISSIFYVLWGWRLIIFAIKTKLVICSVEMEPAYGNYLLKLYLHSLRVQYEIVLYFLFAIR